MPSEYVFRTVTDHVSVLNGNTWGLTLGDLRNLLNLAESLPDEAEVTVEDLVDHYNRMDEKCARRISVHFARRDDA